jgi:hypothetical protein
MNRERYYSEQGLGEWLGLDPPSPMLRPAEISPHLPPLLSLGP